MRSKGLSLFLSVTCALAVEAQLFESIDVRVSNVDVVVTDKAGKPVTGLTAADFELLENGVPQVITNFYEAGGGSAADDAEIPAEMRRRRIVFFVDQDSIDPRRRADAFRAAGKAVDKLLGPNDEAMVVTFFRSRVVGAELTSDRAAIHRALQAASKESHGAGLRHAVRERTLTNAQELLLMATEQSSGGAPRQTLYTIPDAYRTSRSNAQSYTEEVFIQQQNLLAALQQTVNSLAGLEGRKALVFVGGDLQQRPGYDVVEAIEALYRPHGVTATGSTGITQASGRDLGRELGALGRTANAKGVTLYLIDAGDRTSRRSASAGAPILRTENIEDTGIDLETALSMNNLALATGGTALIGSNNFDQAMNQVVQDLSTYYSLGYRPSGTEKNRRLAVSVKKPGLTVRSRRSYTLESVDDQMSDRVVANATHPMRGELGLTVTLGPARADGDAFIQPVSVEFPGSLMTIPDGEELAGEFAVYTVVRSPDGGLSPVARDTRTFRFPKEQAASVAARPMTWSRELKVRPGEQVVSLLLVDRVSGRVGYARETIRVP